MFSWSILISFLTTKIGAHYSGNKICLRKDKILSNYKCNIHMYLVVFFLNNIEIVERSL